MFAWDATDRVRAARRRAGRTAPNSHPRDEITPAVDFRQAGVGGDDSWGAVPHREYARWPQNLAYRLLMRPLGLGDDPGVLARLILPDEAAETEVYAGPSSSTTSPNKTWRRISPGG